MQYPLHKTTFKPHKTTLNVWQSITMPMHLIHTKALTCTRITYRQDSISFLLCSLFSYAFTLSAQEIPIECPMFLDFPLPPRVISSP